MIETFVAMMLVLVGLVGMMSLFSLSVATTRFSRQELISRQKARELLESLYTARNTQQISFDMVNNLSAGGIFLDGFQPVRRAGADGLMGTGDDGEVQEERLPGADGIVGTADDEIRPLSDFERQATITQLSDKLREVAVIVRYTTPQGWQREYELKSYVSAFR
ncbi:MAG: hypothetical protein ACE5JX_08710 [Acidobacteriota bacterium]